MNKYGEEAYHELHLFGKHKKKNGAKTKKQHHVFPAASGCYVHSIYYVSLCLCQSSWFVLEGTYFPWSLTLSISLILGNEPDWSDQTKQMKEEVVYDTPIMLDDSNKHSLGVSSSRNEALQTSLTQEMQLPVVDSPMMEVENYSKAYVSCSRNETGSIVETLELNG